MKKQPPEAQKNKPKMMVNGKTYWWCSTHKSWGGHKESTCELEKETETPETAANTPPCTIIKLSDALSAIMEDKDDGSTQGTSCLLSGLLAIIHKIQKWVLYLFVLLALFPFNILSYDEQQTTYVPKFQRPKYG